MAAKSTFFGFMCSYQPVMNKKLQMAQNRKLILQFTFLLWSRLTLMIWLKRGLLSTSGNAIV